MAQTPSTEDIYEGDGVQTVFPLTFPYLKSDEVFVSVDDVDTPYVWVGGSTASVQLAVAPTLGAIVRVYRNTRAFVPLHVFAGGVPFLPRYIDDNNRQLLYVSQEAINATAGTAAEALVVAEEAKEIAERAEEKVDGAIADSAFVLRLDLASPGGVTGVTRQVSSFAELRTIYGNRDRDRVSMLGYHADAPGYGEATPYWDALSTLPDDGATVAAPTLAMVGRWIIPVGTTASVYQWGAKHATECSDALQACINYVFARGWGEVHFGNGSFFLVNKTLRGRPDIRYTGKSIVRATAPFTGVVVDNFNTGTTTTIASIMFFCDVAPTGAGTVATIYNPTGSRRMNVTIDESLLLDCRDIADYAVFTDNYQYLSIHCRVRAAVKWGVRLNFFGWTGKVTSRITGCAEGGLWVGAGCNGMSFAGLLVWGDDKTSTVAGILVDGDNNGLSLSGATVEKVNVGVLCRSGTGPVDASGVDFEQCTTHVLEADGTGAPTRVNGPISIHNSFLEVTGTTSAIIKATNSLVDVTGCRARNAAAFIEQIGAGYVTERDNVLEASVLSQGTGNIHSRGRSGRALSDKHYSPVSSSLANVREVFNYAYPYTPGLVSSGMYSAHRVTSGTNRTMDGLSEWFVANFNLDVETGRMGVLLNYTGGAKNIEPTTNADHNLGTATKKFDRIVGNAHVQAAGVGATVNPLNNGEMVMQFTSNTQVTIKAKGTDGVVRVANITVA